MQVFPPELFGGLVELLQDELDSALHEKYSAFNESDFEEMLLTTTADFYSRESSKWSEEDSFPDYMCKAEDRLRQEQERVVHYLHSSTEEKLLKVCDDQLLQTPEQQLLEKENSGCEALLRDNKVRLRATPSAQRLPRSACTCTQLSLPVMLHLWRVSTATCLTAEMLRTHVGCSRLRRLPSPASSHMLRVGRWRIWKR